MLCECFFFFNIFCIIIVLLGFHLHHNLTPPRDTDFIKSDWIQFLFGLIEVEADKIRH